MSPASPMMLVTFVLAGTRTLGRLPWGPPLPFDLGGNIVTALAEQEGGQLAAELRGHPRDELGDLVAGSGRVVLVAEPVDHLGWLAGLDGARQASVGDGTPDIGDWHEIHLT